MLSEHKCLPIPHKGKAQFSNSAFPYIILFGDSTFAITEPPLFRYGHMNLIFLFQIHIHSSDLMPLKQSQITAITRVAGNQREV